MSEAFCEDLSARAMERAALVLRRGADAFDLNPDAWTRGELAIDASSGGPIPPENPLACAWCAEGMILKELFWLHGPDMDDEEDDDPDFQVEERRETKSAAMAGCAQALLASFDRPSLALWKWNDGLAKCGADVARLFRRAAASLDAWIAEALEEENATADG